MSRKKSKKPEQFIKKPVYPGGRKAMDEFISSEMRYPQEALANGISGTVRLRIEINYKGDVIRTKVEEGPGYGCNEEAERIARKLKFDVPKNKGVRVTFHQGLHIHFRPKEATGKKRINYTLSSSDSSEKSPEKKSYTYTIRRTGK